MNRSRIVILIAIIVVESKPNRSCNSRLSSVVGLHRLKLSLCDAADNSADER